MRSTYLSQSSFIFDCKPTHLECKAPWPAKHLALCTSCHQNYAEPQAAAAHSKHPAGAQVNCMDCHMPRYNQGIDELVRGLTGREPRIIVLEARQWRGRA